MKTNLILNTDSYKPSMFVQYPPNTTGVYSYIESRGGFSKETVFVGLQMFVMEYLMKPITADDINEAEELLTLHGEPFNRAGWEYILNTHNGYMPVVIKAVPEGSVIPVRNVLATIENTDPQCFWLTTYLETALLRAIWYPTTVATISQRIRKIILEYLEQTGTPADIGFKLHDFGSRGVSSTESSGVGGLAHLVSFTGTDNIIALTFARKYYDSKMAGFSLPASEHSTITSWGKEGEVDAYRNMLKQFGRQGSLLSVVSDSYDIYVAASKLWGEELREEVIKSGATVVIRPDSGDPEDVCVKLISILGDKFGYTTNAKGYKVLKHVRILQGDGVNERIIRSILGHFAVLKWSADNIAFGMGGALLQHCDRDWQEFAMKASSVCIEGVWTPISKKPTTDTKKYSKAGRVTLYKNSTGKYHSGVEDWQKSELVTVYETGKHVTKYTLTEVRENALKVHLA